MKRSYAALALMLVAAVFTGSAAAEGTETLGTPAVSIATGTGVVVAGAGTQAFPNVDRNFSVTVPAGATVKQVLLYWEGHWTDHAPHWSHTPQVDGDNVVSLNGNVVTGTKIGGSTAFYTQFTGAVEGTEKHVAYRADVTNLSLVSAGVSNLTIGNMSFESNYLTGFPFNQGNDGAAVVVVYELAGMASSIGLKDGLDLAYANFSAPLDTTVPQTFTFPAAAESRSGSLSTLAGSIGLPSGPQGLRGNVLQIAFDTGQTASVVNPWASNQGAEFDAITTPVTIPAGAASMTVQALSQGGDLPASFAWIGATLTVPTPPPPPPPPPPGGEGCTPGYWKNHLDSWAGTGYSPQQTIASVFSNAGTLGSATLLEALSFGGGSSLTEKKQILLRAAVASLLNSAHPGVDFALSTAEVIAAVNAALASSSTDEVLALATSLDTSNNSGCELN